MRTSLSITWSLHWDSHSVLPCPLSTALRPIQSLILATTATTENYNMTSYHRTFQPSALILLTTAVVVAVVAENPNSTRAFSGRDTTIYPFFTGKKAWFKTSLHLDLPALQGFGENSSTYLSDDVKNQARELTIGVYASKADHSEDFDLAKLRVYKFLNNRSTLLKLLPPTENAFDLHLKRAALATMTDKGAHIAKPDLPSFTDYGWVLSDGKAVPCPSTEPAWPMSMDKAISCNCIKGCQKNCSCSKKNIPCYLGCRCQGLETRCCRICTHDSDTAWQLSMHPVFCCLKV